MSSVFKIGRSVGRSTPPILASSGQEWQFHIATVRAHIGRSSGRSTGRSTPLTGRSASGSEWQFQIFTVRAHMGKSTGIPPQVDLPVDLNGNFTFLLSE